MSPARHAAILLAAGWTLLALPGASAARLPDWAQSVANTAPEIPEGISEDRSQILLSETRVQVGADGKLQVRRRMASQALSPNADEVGLGAFHFVEGTQVRRSKAWHLPPEGKAKKSRGAIDVTLEDSFLTDQRTRFVHVAGIEKGSLVFFEFEAELEPDQLAYQVYFHEAASTELFRFELETPSDWSVSDAWLRQEGPGPRVSGTTRTWEVQGLQAPDDEPLGESALDTAPLLVVNFVPPPGIKPEPAAFPDWPALAEWYEYLIEGRDAVSPPVTSMAEAAFAGAGADGISRIRAAAEYVRDNVRYVAKEIGVGNLRPFPAGGVAERLYGDCKDKGTLLRALLATEGRETYPMLVHAALPQTVSADVPSLGAFNHFVIGVPVGDDEELPPSLEHAVIDGEDLGRILVVDATSEITSIGYLPDYLQGKTALLAAGEKSRLIDLPACEPSANRVERRLDAEILPDLSVKARLETRRYGSPASIYRYAFRQSEREYREAIERALSEQWSECELEELSVTEEDENGAFVETIEATVAPPADPAELMELFPWALDDLPQVNLGRRETAVKYRNAMAFRYESAVKGVPDGVPTPTAKEREGEGWAARSSFEREGGLLRGTWELELTRLRFEPEQFRDLKKLWSSARRTSSTKVPRTGAP
jgi:hypothetical protein